MNNKQKAIGISAAMLSLIFFMSKRVNDGMVESINNPPLYRMTGQYLVSVIIPSLNEEEYLPLILDSIDNQTYEPIEVIIADSSKSPSKEAIQKIANLYGAKVIHVPKLGVSKARNEGVKAANGDILCVTDADCILKHDYIENMVKDLDNGYILAYGGDPTYGNPFVSTITYLGRAIIRPITLTPGRGIVVWKDVYEKLGGYDESIDPTLFQREDIDLGQRIESIYGPNAIKYHRGYWQAESPRRQLADGLNPIHVLFKRGSKSGWQVARGVRGTEVISI